MAKPTLRTPLCDLLECEFPIVLAGMGGDATTPELVAAVSNAGGFAVDGVTNNTPEEILEDVRQIRELTDKPFGLDILLPASRADVPDSREQARERIKREFPRHWSWIEELRQEFEIPDVLDPNPHVIWSTDATEAQVEACLEARVHLLAVGLGDPGWVVPKAHKVGTKVLGLAGSPRNAIRQQKAGVDIVVAQGYEAGGHTGLIANFPLIPEVVDLVSPIPVIAGGSITEGRQIAAALCLGAVGVWIGSAFLLSEETGIGRVKRQQLIVGQTDDFILSRATTGKPARGYKTAFKEAWEQSGLSPLPFPLQGVLVEDFMEGAKQAGRTELLHNPAGQGTGRLSQIKPAKQIVEELVQGTLEVLAGMQTKVAYSIP